MRSAADLQEILHFYATDVANLEYENQQLVIDLQIAREMLSEALEIAHQAIAYAARRANQ